eukprot:scaffold147913_cov19-Tisochrysis_lutea.AAC.1
MVRVLNRGSSNCQVQPYNHVQVLVNFKVALRTVNDDIVHCNHKVIKLALLQHRWRNFRPCIDVTQSLLMEASTQRVFVKSHSPVPICIAPRVMQNADILLDNAVAFFGASYGDDNEKDFYFLWSTGVLTMHNEFADMMCEGPCKVRGQQDNCTGEERPTEVVSASF